MKRGSVRISTLLVLASLAACSAFSGVGGESPSAQNTPTVTAAARPAEESPSAGCLPAGPWTLRLELSGGIAGVHQELRLSSQGELRARDLRRGITRRAFLPADEVQALAELIQASCPWEMPRAAGRCADCFVYYLELRGGARPIRLRIDAPNQAGQGLRALLRSLSEMLASTLAADS